MSYQVLARKWRPRSFPALVGQAHVVRALVNALDNDRLHHAFLFTGTRGVGKTTIARIFAKSLNCERGVGSNPCGECSACREIDDSRFVDLIEVDAASRTKVEDTRELLENVQYAPTRGRYKVYLVDEVHMLSTHSFNALLKTLEEPPPHVKFLLATTDPQRLPVTILSRCLQFNLKRLPAALIVCHLENILGQENIECEPPALNLVARAAEGSMRDALSLLDQAIAFGGGRVVETDVRAMLGAIDRGHVWRLLDALAGGDGAQVLNTVAELDTSAPDYTGVLAELINALQRIALAQAVPEAIDSNGDDADPVRRLAAALRPEDVQLFYQIALIGRRDLPLSPEPRGGFEMIMLRMLCFRPEGEGDIAPRPPVRQYATPVRASDRMKETAAPASSRTIVSTGSVEADWNAIVERLDIKGMARQLALNCVLDRREGDAVHLLLEPAHAQMRIKSAEERLRAALEDYYGRPVLLNIRIGEIEQHTPAHEQARRCEERRQAAVETISRDPNVRALCDTFGAQVKNDSITPTD